MFRITDGKGFGITFENGYTVSVQFGYGNYADNYDMDDMRHADFRERNIEAGRRGSRTAECAVINPKGDLIKLEPLGEDAYIVSNRSVPSEVLKIINWASSL